MKKWYLICTKPGQENLALHTLQTRGLHCFYPTLTTAQQQTEPLFPRYIFVQLEDPLMGQTWSSVRTAAGVARIVNTSHETTDISDELILFIRAKCLPMAPGLRLETSPHSPNRLRNQLEALFNETNSFRRVMSLIELLTHRPATGPTPLLRLAS
jgi:transcriptional antiterminator RfaH